MEKDLSEICATQTLQRFGAFVQNNRRRLGQLLHSLPKSDLQVPAQPPAVALNFAYGNEKVFLPHVFGYLHTEDKVYLTLHSICYEASTLMTEGAQMLQEFTAYDERVGRQPPTAAQEDLLLEMSKGIGCLCKLAQFLNHCTKLSVQLVQQCGRILAEQTLEAKIVVILRSMINLFELVITTSELLNSSHYCRYWRVYKKTLLLRAKQAPNADSICGLQHLITDIDVIFSFKVQQDLLQAHSNLKSIIGEAGTVKFMSNVNIVVDDIINAYSSTNNIESAKGAIGINMLLVAIYVSYAGVDKKLLKKIAQLNNSLGDEIFLRPNLSWQPLKFMQKYCLLLAKEYATCMPNNAKIVAGQAAGLAEMYVEVCVWLLQTQRVIDGLGGTFKLSGLKEVICQILLGIQHASTLHTLIQNLLKQQAGRTPTDDNIKTIYQIIELLQHISDMFTSNSTRIATIINPLSQHLKHKLLKRLHNYVNVKPKANKPSTHNTIFNLVVKCFNGPLTAERIFLANLILKENLLRSEAENGSKELAELRLALNNLTLINSFQQKLAEFSSFPAGLKELCREHAGTPDQVLAELASNSKFVDEQEKQRLRAMLDELISGFCAEIEDFVRMEAHSKLLLQQNNAFECFNVDFRDTKNKFPSIFDDKFIFIEDYVAKHLSSESYNIMVLYSNDYEAYVRVCHVAAKRLLLNTTDNFMPNSLSLQNADTVEALKDIERLVLEFDYEMNTQAFVSKNTAGQKHINAIAVRGVCSFAQWHDAGLVNAYMNLTYQYMRQKVHKLYEILCDEQLQSCIMKELRSLSRGKQEHRYQVLSFDQAVALNKSIRSLGLSHNGEYVLRLLETLVTQIGKAAGCLRMMCAARKQAHFLSRRYTTGIAAANDWHREFLSPETTASMNIFISQIDKLSNDNLSAVDALQVLLNAFQAVFSKDRNSSIARNFLPIVPPLIVNYVEERMNTKQFDNGFALGLSYIIEILKSNSSAFTDLAWLQDICERFQLQRRKLLNAEEHGPSPDQQSKTYILTRQRIAAQERAYNLLYYNVRSVKLLLQ